jgi:hypothetical protein
VEKWVVAMVTIRVGPVEFEIREVEGLCTEDGRELDGTIDCCQGFIAIKSGMSQQRAYWTLWHELTHAIMAYSGHEVDDGVCDAMATGVMGVLRDNKWIREVPGE